MKQFPTPPGRQDGGATPPAAIPRSWRSFRRAVAAIAVAGPLAACATEGRPAPPDTNRPAFEARFLHLCDLAAAELRKETTPFGDRKNEDPKTHHMPFFEDAHAVRSLAVAYDLTGNPAYLEACRVWSDRILAFQARMLPRGAYYLNYYREPEQERGEWFVADAGCVGLAVLATAERCADPADQARYLDSVRAFARLVMANYVAADGGVANGHWSGYAGPWWCSTATFGTLAFRLYAATGEEPYLHAALGALNWTIRHDFRKAGPVTFEERPSGVIFYCFELYAAGLKHLPAAGPERAAALGQIDLALNWLAGHQKTRGAAVKDYLEADVDMAGMPYLMYAFGRALPNRDNLAAPADAELRYIGDLLLARGEPNVSRLMTWEVLTWGLMSYAERLRPGMLVGR